MSTINKDENLLTEFFDRSIESNDDEYSVYMLCSIIKDNPSLVTKATNLIAAKITSDDLKNSLRSLQVLEVCMAKCGPEFQTEVSKYRFLNKLIALVSPNYSAKDTPKEIRDKIVDCLSLWTVQYPDKDKIRSSFDMLCKQGIIDTSVSHKNLQNDNTHHNKRPQTFMNEENELILKQLLKSSNPEDLRRANLFIQFHVNQDGKKFERKFKQKSELTKIEDTANVLIDVLNSYVNVDTSDMSKDGETTKNDSLLLLNDLYEMCEKYKSIIDKMPNIMEDSEEELIKEIFRVNNTLLSAMKMYDNLFKAEFNTASSLESQNSVASPVDDEKIKNLRLYEILSTSFNEETLVETNNVSEEKKSIFEKPEHDGLAELNDIFKNLPTIRSSASSNCSGLDAIKPILPVKINNEEEIMAEKEPEECKKTPESDKVDLLSTIDKISEELFQENLKANDRIKSFVREPERKTLNEMLTKNKKSPSKSLKNIQDDPMNSKFKTSSPSLEEIKKLIFNEPNRLIKSEASPEKNNRTESFNCDARPYKHLSEIYIDLSDVTPSNIQPKVLLNDPDGLNIKLNFTENKPGIDITVMVISTINENRANIMDFHFEASVPLPCKLYLLPPSGTALPGRKPFRLPSDLQQILLLYNPTKQPVDITCILSYVLGDDPDPIKQSIFAEGII